MVFSTELASKNKVTTFKNKYLEAGIHENVKFDSVRSDVSPTGNTFIEFKFKKDDQELIHTEWEPKAREGYTDEQNQNKATNQVSRIMQILRCFYPKEVLNFTGSTYKEFTNWVVSLLNAANKDTLLKVKIVYNDKGYTTLPNYAKFAFIEPMDIPMGYYEEGKNDSMIVELSIDQFTKPVVADTEVKEDNPLADTTSTALSNLPGDDLPF